MKSFKNTLMAIALGALGMSSLSITAFEEQKHIMIKVDKTNNNDTSVNFNIDGVSESFTLPELQPGESKVITTAAGNNINVTKTESGIDIDVDGKSIQIPVFKGNLGAKIHRSAALHELHENSVEISGVKLDDNQKQIIIDAFAAAGIDKKVNFSEEKFIIFSENSMNDDHGLHQIILKNGDMEREIEFESHSGANFEFIVKENKEHKQLHVDTDKDQ